VSDFSGTFDPMADALVGVGSGQPIDLRSFLGDLGVPPAEVERAAEDGALELLALELIANADPPAYEIGEVASLSGLDLDMIRSYWRALGFPEPQPDEKVFSDTDLAVLSEVVWFISDGALEPGVALQMARVIGSSLERIASAQVDTIETRRAAAAEALASTPAVFDDPQVATAAVERALEVTADGLEPLSLEDQQLAIRRGAELLPMMPKVMEFVWRRHLGLAARRRRLRAAAADGRRIVVGFADMVGFTSRTLQLDEEELADVVGRFESTAYDVVTAHNGRVVKMIGDEVMFVCDSVPDAAELALALAETYRNDPALSDVRVGMAAGSALEREGDVYGPVVNLASRIVSIAYPGAVVVSEDVYVALVDDDAFDLRSIRQHYLKDIGRVRLWTMRHADDETESPYRNARDRRAARREFLLKRRAERIASSHAMPAEVEDEVVEILEDAGLLDSAGMDEILRRGDHPTEELEAITDVVLDSDIDESLQVELLSDLEAARRLAALEREAQQRADEADLEAESRLEAIEAEVRRTVARIEHEARRRVEEALADAERRAEQVNEEASRKVKRVAEDVERKADQAEKEALRIAQRKTAKRKAERERATRDRAKADRDRAKAEREAVKAERDAAKVEREPGKVARDKAKAARDKAKAARDQAKAARRRKRDDGGRPADG
jgi:adenylate cyclase